ncbi:MAG: glycogen synthase [Candidatus Aureabacteria bacterium]|nr:glycogen synthase [Candidatus Auribacterota bacterium]
MASSEVAPFAKVGGLADMVSGLSKSLKKSGHDVRIIMPYYKDIHLDKKKLKTVLTPMGVHMGGGAEEWCAVHVFFLEGDPSVQVYFIEHHYYFNRSGIYFDRWGEFGDNAKRFAFFCLAVCQFCRDLPFKPDVIHCHDWPTSLIPAYLKLWYPFDPILGRCASVLTIHNIGYPGTFPKDFWTYLGLPAHSFCEAQFESWNQISFLKGGIYYADKLTTVSPFHAMEVRTPEGGKGLAPYLNRRGSDLFGILNGADYDIWNPETDPFLPANYSEKDLTGKASCKKELQKRFGLEINPDRPIFGVIARLTFQKGLDLLMQIVHSLFSEMLLQIIVLGDGESYLVSGIHYFTRIYPGRFGSYIGYNEELSHLIEAGSDFFLMPSLYEPCGLNQFYSLRYGTLPVVRATGGLVDTVGNYDEATGGGTGFIFHEPSPRALYYTIGWAVSTWYDRPKHIHKMISRAMKKRFDWERSSKEYTLLYEAAVRRK